MNMTRSIREYASVHGAFTRDEILRFLRSGASLNEQSLDVLLYRLVQQGVLSKSADGEYHSNLEKSLFKPVARDEIKSIYGQLKEQFPFAAFSIWSSADIFPFMHHIPNLDIVYVDVEKDALESVFSYLLDNKQRQAFLAPDRNTFGNYISGKPSVILHQEVSQAPVIEVEGIRMPSLEKIMVDILAEPDFFYLQGYEIDYIYEAITSKYAVNEKALLRYAGRRNRTREVTDTLNYIKENDIFD